MSRTPKANNPSSAQATTVASQHRKEMMSVVLVLLVAALLRTVYYQQYRANMPYFSSPILDSMYYDAWAQRVMQGRGYGSMPFYMAPLYPYFLAAFYWVAGHSYAAVYAFQMALGLVNLLLTYLLGRRLFGYLAGILAMAMLTLYAPVVYLETKLLTETLAIFLNLLSLLLVMKALERRSSAAFLWVGLAMGLSAVCRPAALLTVGLILVWLFVNGSKNKRPRVFLHTGAFVLGVVLVILPVTVRNYAVGHDFALITTNSGIVFVQANHPGANGVSAAIPGFTGSIMTQQEEEMANTRKALGHPVKPSESSAFWMGQGLKFIRESPLEFIKLLGMKAIWCAHGLEADCSYNVYLETRLVPALRLFFMPFALLAGLAFFGLIVSRGRPDANDRTILGLYIISVFVSMFIFSVTSRYRVPAIPGMCVFAGGGIVAAAGAVANRLWRGAIAALGCVSFFFLVYLVPYHILRVTAASLANLGTIYSSNGQLTKAVSAFEESLKLEPDQPSALGSYGVTLLLSDKPGDAVEYLKEAVRLSPENATIQQNLATALLRSGHPLGAEQEFRKAISLDNNSSEAHAGLAEALSALGNTNQMEKERSAALRLKPDIAKSHLDLANVFAAQGNLSEAVRQYQRTLFLDPRNADAYANLGLALKDMGKLDEAVKAYRAALAIKPDLVRAQNNLAVALYYSGRYAEAWHAVHTSQRLGGQLHPGFIKALSDKMPEPTE